MTRKLAPGTPELVLPDGTKSGPVISDSVWEDLPVEDKTKENLGRIAREQVKTKQKEG
jgi:hypothetical protein